MPTAVLRSPGMFTFYVDQARQLARWGQLELAFLTHNGRDIAFEYGFTAKGVYHSFKVGYDQAYAAYSPGQLLTGRLLEHFHADPARLAYDCLGPLNDAVARWQPATYEISRLAIAPRLVGRMLIRAYQWAGPPLRQLRRIARKSSPPHEHPIDVGA
jgi:hypothetical protein